MLGWAQTVSVPLVWLQLDPLDVDPGRFWSVLVYGIRRHYPAWGQSLLNGIMDHHASPNPQVFNQFKRELAGKPFVLVISNCQLIWQGTVSKQLLSLLEAFRAESMLIFLNDKDEFLIEEDLNYLSQFKVKTENDPKLEELDLPTFRNLLSIFDIMVARLVKRAGVLDDPNLIDYFVSAAQIDFLSNAVLNQTK